jgi:hypothetical protein
VVELRISFSAFADPGDFSLYPTHFLFARVLHSWTGFIVSAFVMAGVFMYAYVYRVTRSRTAAAFAGLAYAMSEAMVERVPHLGTLHCFAWLPLILLAIEEVRGERRRTWIAVGGCAVACAFLSGHPQPAIYTTCQRAACARRRAGGARANSHAPLSCRHVHLRRRRVDQGWSPCRSRPVMLAGSELRPVRRSCELAGADVRSSSDDPARGARRTDVCRPVDARIRPWQVAVPSQLAGGVLARHRCFPAGLAPATPHHLPAC